MKNWQYFVNFANLFQYYDCYIGFIYVKRFWRLDALVLRLSPITPKQIILMFIFKNKKIYLMFLSAVYHIFSIHINSEKYSSVLSD